MEAPRHSIGDRMFFTDNGVQKSGIVERIRWVNGRWAYTLTEIA